MRYIMLLGVVYMLAIQPAIQSFEVLDSDSYEVVDIAGDDDTEEKEKREENVEDKLPAFQTEFDIDFQYAGTSFENYGQYFHTTEYYMDIHSPPPDYI